MATEFKFTTERRDCMARANAGVIYFKRVSSIGRDNILLPISTFVTVLPLLWLGAIGVLDKVTPEKAIFSGTVTWAVVTATNLGLWLLLLLLHHRASISRIFSADSPYLGPTHFVADDAGLRIDYPQVTEIYRWSTVRRIERFKDHLAVQVDNGIAFTLPVRAIGGDAEVAEFVAMVERRITGRTLGSKG